MRGVFSGSSSSRSSSKRQSETPPSPSRRSFAFMKYSPGRKSSTAMRRIRERTGQIAQQIETPEMMERKQNQEPQDRIINKVPLKPPAQSRKKVALDMFLEQQDGAASVGSEASSRTPSGAAARRLARAKRSSGSSVDRTVNSMSTFPSNSSMQRSFAHKQQSSSSRSIGSNSSAAARRRMRNRSRGIPPPVETPSDLYAELKNDDSPNNRPASTPDSSHRSLDAVNVSHGFSFDAFGLDADEVDSEVNAALQDLAGSHPALTKLFDGFPTVGLDSPAGSCSASTPTLDVDSVDGFKSLPMNIAKPSPASSERSTLTTSSPNDDAGDGRINMFKQQAGFHTSKQPKPDLHISSDGWESFAPSPRTPRYAASEPGAPTDFFTRAWPKSARQAPKLPDLFKESSSDKGSDDGFSQSSWQGDSDGELSPEAAQQLEKSASTEFEESFSSTPVTPGFASASLTNGFAAADSTPGDSFDFFKIGDNSTPSKFTFSDTGTPSSAADFTFSDTGAPSSAAGFSFSDARTPSSAAGITFSNSGAPSFTGAPRSEAGASSTFGAPSDVGVAMDFGSDIGVTSDMGVNSDFLGVSVPDEIVGKKKSKSKRSTEDDSVGLGTTVDSFEADTVTMNSSPASREVGDFPVQKVSNLAAKWERKETKKGSVVAIPSPKQWRPPQIADDDQVVEENPSLETRPAHIEPVDDAPGVLDEPLSDLDAKRQQLNDIRNGEIAGPEILSKVQAEKTTEQQKRADECAAQRTSFGSYKERLRPAHLRKDPSSTKSEVGAYSSVGRSEMTSLFNKFERNQPSSASFRETKSEVGASSGFLSSVKLRNTGAISKLVSIDGSASASNGSRESPTEFDNWDPQETHDSTPKSQPQKLTYRERKELERKQQQEQEAKERENQYSSELAKPKLTYRQQRELELQQQRKAQAEKEAEQRAQGEERDVASLIRRRVAMNKTKSPDVSAGDKKTAEDITLIRNRLKKVSVDKEHSYEGQPSPIALEEETLTTENSYSSNSLERIGGDHVSQRHNDFASGSGDRDHGSSNVRASHQVPTHIDAPSTSISEEEYQASHAGNAGMDSAVVAIDSDETPLQNSFRPAFQRDVQAREGDRKQTGDLGDNEDSSEADKEAKKTFLNSFFGSRAGLPVAPMNQDTNEETLIPQRRVKQPPVQSGRSHVSPDSPSVIAKEAAETSFGNAADYSENSSVLRMDIGAATAVLVRKNQQDQAAVKISQGIETGMPGAASTPQPFILQPNSLPPAITSGGVALKDDPKYEKYFRMLKVGMPLDVVKHAMTRDGIDASVMDGDHNAPAGGVPLKDDPKFAKYFSMLKMGLPMGAVRNAMQRDGLDPSVMDGDHNAPAHSSATSENHADKRPKDTHRRTRLHWETLRKVRKNSLWAKINDDPELQQLSIDEDEFAELFQAELTPSAFQKKKSPTPLSTSQKRGPSVRVIDPKRANNGGIVLARLKISQDDLADAVDKIDDTVLTAEQMQHIVEYLPTSEERKNLEKYMLEGDQDAAEKFDMLCECEKFMVAMMTVKHAKRKVRCLLFKLQFQSCLGCLEADATTVETACDELSNSVRLRKLLGIVLNIGNRLNTAGNGSKNKAGAFTLESLLKLSHAKAFDRKTTFLNYVVLIVQRNNELLLNFKDDLPTVMKANKVYWDQCLIDLEEVENQLENARRISLHQARLANPYRLKKKNKSSSKKGDDDEDCLSEVELSLEEEVENLRRTQIGQFTLFAIKTVSSLRAQVEVTNKKFGRLLEYFGEEDKRSEMQPHELFTIMCDFCKDFDKAREQVAANEKKKMRDERKRQASSKKQLGTRTDGSRPTTLRASNLQPNMSSVMKGIAPVSPTAKSDPGLRPAYRNKHQKVDVQRVVEQRNGSVPPDNSSRNGFSNPNGRASPHKKSGPSIPVDPYNSIGSPQTASQQSSLRQKARLRREHQVSHAKSPKPQSSTAEHSETSSQQPGRPPLDQTLSPRSNIRLKRRMQQRNGVGSSRRLGAI